MQKIIREKYENGVLVARDVEITGARWVKAAKLVVQLVVAVSLATIAAVITHDSLLAAAINDNSETTGASCQGQEYRS